MTRVRLLVLLPVALVLLVVLCISHPATAGAQPLVAATTDAVRATTLPGADVPSRTVDWVPLEASWVVLLAGGGAIAALLRWAR